MLRRRAPGRLLRLTVVLSVTATVVACRSPHGALQGAFQMSSAPGVIRVTGWAVDPDVADPIAVVVAVSGPVVGYGLADGPVPDGAGGAPGTGFDITVPAPAGWHEVCVSAVDRTANPPTVLGCRQVRVGETVTPVDARYRASVLTASPGHLDTNSITVSGGSTVLASPGGATDGNLRFVFVEADEPETADQTSCATWSDASAGLLQQGVALRVGDRSPTRAITVTKNVWGGVSSIINVHLWDASRPDGGIEPIGRAMLGPVLERDGVALPLPWRMCARVAGDRLTFKVWPLPGPEPAWGDPAHGVTLGLPPDAPRTGRPGWYGGHLDRGEHLTYSEMAAGAS